MKRSQFIKNLLALGGLKLLPNNLVTSFTKFYLLQFFVAGFRFYKGMELLAYMQEGDLLELVREPNNEHDNWAVALYWNNEKIGYVPRDENALLSRLLDAKALDIIAEITHLNKEVKPWESMHTAVYFLKETGFGVPAEMEYLTVLQTPQYRTYKAPENKIYRISLSEKDLPEDNNPDWYGFLVENSKDDSIYDIIHNSNLNPEYRYGKQTGEYLLVNKKRVPPDEAVNQVILAAERLMGELNNVFGEDGYIVLSTQEAETLVARTEAIVEVIDKFGQRYIELLLK